MQAEVRRACRLGQQGKDLKFTYWPARGFSMKQSQESDRGRMAIKGLRNAASV